MSSYLNEKHICLVLLSTTMSGVFIREVYRSKHPNKNKIRNFHLQCQNLSDFERVAKEILKPHRFYYYSYTAGQGITSLLTRLYFDRKLLIIPRVLIDVENSSLEIQLFGNRYSNPIMIAPTTFHCLAHPDGEIATARGASLAGSCYAYNWMYSTKAENEVLEIEGPKFLHVYLTTPKELLQRIVLDAKGKGYHAILVTCDHPTDRVRDDVLPMFEEASRTTDLELLESMPMPNMNKTDIVEKQQFSKVSPTWDDLDFVRRLTPLPIICKGILSPIDAQLAIDHGVNGIIVSNHGGRQVDSALPAVQCLQEIVKFTEGRLEVFVDSGIRNGTDILKCLALGARAVFIGRPILYGLTCGGHEGVQKVLDILKKELTYDMACVGCKSLDQITQSILYNYSNKS